MQGYAKDLLFVLVEKYKIFVLDYNSETGQ